MSGPRPSPVPLAINARAEFRPALRALVGGAERDPMRLTCAYAAASHADACATLRIGHLDHASSLVLPVVGPWPMDDLSPRGLRRLLREILAEARIDDDHHQQALRRHVAVALAMCDEDGSTPPWASDPSTPIIEVEVCLVVEQGVVRPVFWTEDPNGSPVDLAIDVRLLEAAAGRMPLPCHVYDMEDDVCVGFSASDCEGVHVRVEPMDAMAELRVRRALRDARARSSSPAFGTAL